MAWHDCWRSSDQHPFIFDSHWVLWRHKTHRTLKLVHFSSFSMRKHWHARSHQVSSQSLPVLWFCRNLNEKWLILKWTKILEIAIILVQGLSPNIENVVFSPVFRFLDKFDNVLPILEPFLIFPDNLRRKSLANRPFLLGMNTTSSAKVSPYITPWFLNFDRLHIRLKT